MGMNILLLGNAYFRRDFEARGHQVKTCSIDNRGAITLKELPTPIHSVLSSLPCGWNPDLVLLGDDSYHPMFLGLEFLDMPLGWYAIDSHLHWPWHKAYAAAFDFVFVAQKEYVDGYRRDHTRQIVQWLPLFCNSTVDRCLNLPKLYDLSFVGTLDPSLNPDRVRLIHDIRTRFPIYTTTGDYVSIFNQSKLVLNQCVAKDVNFRTFQAMACGSLLLMEKVGNGLEELFQDRVHLALYDKGNVDQIIELTHYYLEHASEREEVASRGREAVLSAHTSAHRAEAILNLLHTCEVNELVKRRKSCLLEIEAHLALAYDYAAIAYSKWPSPRFHATSTALAAAIRRELPAWRKEFAGGDARRAHMGLGMAAMGEGQAEVAWERFAAVLAEEPDDAEAIHWLLRAGRRRGRCLIGGI